VCLCGVYVLLRLCVDERDARRLTSLGTFAVYVDGLAALVNATNADVTGTATDFNDVVMTAFSAITRTQITNLHDLVDHFNRGLHSIRVLSSMPPEAVRSVVMSMSVCLSACLFAYLENYTTEPH